MLISDDPVLASRRAEKEAATPTPTVTGGGLATSRRQRWTWGSVTVVVVLAGYGVILLENRRFFYADDTESGAIPNWIELGRILRSGSLPSISPNQWMGGNWAVEGQGGLWNPVQILINLIAPSVDNLSLLSAVVKCAFALILALGAYRVALEYGARAPWAAVAGAAVPFAGFPLFYDEASWVTALTSMAWIAQAWASSLRYARGRSGPLPMFAFLYLALSVGYAPAAVAAGLLVASLVIGEVLHQGCWRPSLKLAAAAAAAAACSALTFLPALLSSSVTWRSGQGNLYNNNFLTAPWSETLTASLPSGLPSIQAWAGQVAPWPVTYVAWFLVPALAFVDWSAAKRSARALSSVLIFFVVMLIVTDGPSNVGALRWPARWLPYVAITMLLLVCVLLSRHGTRKPSRARLVAALVLVTVLVARGFSADPGLLRRHVLVGAGIVLAGAVVLVAARRTRDQVVASLLLLSSLLVLWFQMTRYPYYSAWNLPTSKSHAQAAFPDYAGTTLQLGDRGLVPMADRSPTGAWSSLVFGNYARTLNLEYVNSYTSIGYAKFADLLCMSYDGSTCSAAYQRLFSTEPVTGKTYADLMMIDRVVLQRVQYPGVANQAPPSGWSWRGGNAEALVLERTAGLQAHTDGRISSTRSVASSVVGEFDNGGTYRVASTNGGSVVFARLAWPGYTASINGKDVPVSSIDGVFLSVDVPASTDGTLTVAWRAPGTSLGYAGIALGLIGIATLAFVRRRERRRQRPAGPEFVKVVETSGC